MNLILQVRLHKSLAVSGPTQPEHRDFARTEHAIRLKTSGAEDEGWIRGQALFQKFLFLGPDGVPLSAWDRKWGTGRRLGLSEKERGEKAQRDSSLRGGASSLTAKATVTGTSNSG
jgi:hypothetical protein